MAAETILGVHQGKELGGETLRVDTRAEISSDSQYKTPRATTRSNNIAQIDRAYLRNNQSLGTSYLSNRK